MITKIGKLPNMDTLPVWQMVSTRLSSLSSAPSPSKRSFWSFSEICEKQYFISFVMLLMFWSCLFKILKFMFCHHSLVIILKLKLLFELNTHWLSRLCFKKCFRLQHMKWWMMGKFCWFRITLSCKSYDSSRNNVSYIRNPSGLCRRDIFKELCFSGHLGQQGTGHTKKELRSIPSSFSAWMKQRLKGSFDSWSSRQLGQQASPGSKKRGKNVPLHHNLSVLNWSLKGGVE